MIDSAVDRAIAHTNLESRCATQVSERSEHVGHDIFRVQCELFVGDLHHETARKLQSVDPFSVTGWFASVGYRLDETPYAKRLPTSKLGVYIETRVNNFLKKKEAGAGEVSIRVVASSDKLVEVKPGMRGRFVECGEPAAGHPVCSGEDRRNQNEIRFWEEFEHARIENDGAVGSDPAGGDCW